VTQQQAEGTGKGASLLCFALFAYLLCMIVLITLMPFRFQWPTRVHILTTAGLFDVLTNISLFLLLGFCYRLVRHDQHDRWGVRTLGFGVVLSVSIELAQLFLRGRYSSVADIASNSLGAWGGALLHRLITQRLHERLVGQLALELPLMQLFYLLLPLLWLNVLAAGRDNARLWLTSLLGLCGSSILAALWQHRLRPAGVVSVPALGLGVALWFLLGVMPGITRRPAFFGLCSVGVGLAVPLLISLPGLAGTGERRFELLTLRRIGPLYAVYLVLLVLWPWPWTPQAWHASVGFAEIADRPGVIPTLRILEDIAAFTLLGYMLAELRGRRDEPVHQTLQWLLVCGGLCSSGLELARGFHPKHMASLAHMLMMTSAALYGGVIYRLQLAMVRRLLALDTNPSTP
jgi:glycopeptide antibiotics resistance protein